MNINELFDDQTVEYPETIEVPGILNTHTHCRDTDKENDGRAEMHIPLLAQAYDDVLGMGNTATPLTTSLLAREKGTQWRQLIPAKSRLRIHVAGLMTETTNPDDVVAGYDKPDGEEDFLAMKTFLRSVSNAHGADVDDVSKMIPVLKALTHTKFKHKKRPMVFPIHAERKFSLEGERILFLDRERAAIERDIPYILREVPEAHIIICHVSDASTVDAIRYYRSCGYNIWGEICPHYSQYTCDDLFEGPGGSTMLNTHLFCLPIFKTEKDRKTVLEAMLSGEPWWIFGADEACWTDDPSKDSRVKINKKGFVFGGQTQDPRATISYVLEKAVEAGKLEVIPGLLSHNGRDALGLERSKNIVRFRRQDWTVQETVERDSPTLGHLVARVAAGGQQRKFIREERLVV